MRECSVITRSRDWAGPRSDRRLSHRAKELEVEAAALQAVHAPGDP
jgi:hypothetical protein